MATYTAHPAHTMAANDFTLYPYSDVWAGEQPFLPTSSYADSAYLTATAFDSYQAQYQHARPEHLDVASNTHLQHPKARLQASSPANSTSNSFDHPNPPALSTVSDSGASVQSTISSAMASPSAQPQGDWSHRHFFPDIVCQTDGLFATSGFEFDSVPATDKACVDPSLIQPSYSPNPYMETQFSDMRAQTSAFSRLPSPLPSRTIDNSPRAPSVKPVIGQSPYTRPQQMWRSDTQYRGSRRASVSSVHSRQSHNSQSSDDSNKGLCPIATCGRHVKDLKAHMLTHQNERPEKCPIPTCEYHTKGFARKYDKNRHTLTHYKGTMVCGFCPGSGSAAEKSFNRADVFKRHLTSVHNVEQTPPNARRKSPTAANKKPCGSREVSGMCSTCGLTFANAQDFYEHLDDCVLRVVQQADPSEAINERILTEVSADGEVQQTMEKHMLPTSVDLNAPTTFDEDDEAEDDDEMDEDDTNDGTYGSRRGKSIKARKPDGNRISNTGAITKPTKRGLTYSRNGVPLTGATSGKGSKRRKNYPLSWGAAPDKMRMKKRVLCVYDGQRRLWKDDMMLDADHEVRIQLPGDERAWVTDLDMATMRRAEGLHNATEEEKGPWIADGDVESLMA